MLTRRSLNVRDLRAMRLACQAFRDYLKGKCVAVRTDNTIAIFYINRQGGAHCSLLCQEALDLWHFFIAHEIHIEGSYLPGFQNVLEDHLCKSISAHEWSLCPGVASNIFQRCGIPQIDLFVTESNRKCK